MEGEEEGRVREIEKKNWMAKRKGGGEWEYYERGKEKEKDKEEGLRRRKEEGTGGYQLPGRPFDLHPCVPA